RQSLPFPWICAYPAFDVPNIASHPNIPHGYWALFQKHRLKALPFSPFLFLYYLKLLLSCALFILLMTSLRADRSASVDGTTSGPVGYIIFQWLRKSSYDLARIH